MRRVAHEMVTVQPLAEHPLADRDRFGGVGGVEPGASPRVFVAFDDEGRKSVFESIAVRLEHAEFVLDEEECERVERTRGAEPDEVCRAHIEMRLEDRLRVRWRIALLTPSAATMRSASRQPSNESRAPILATLQLKRTSTPSDTARRYRMSRRVRRAIPLKPCPPEVMVVSPMTTSMSSQCAKCSTILAVRFLVGVAEVFERLVGEDDAPSEGVAGRVAFEYRDVVLGRAFLRRRAK